MKGILAIIVLFVGGTALAVIMGREIGLSRTYNESPLWGLRASAQLKPDPCFHSHYLQLHRTRDGVWVSTLGDQVDSPFGRRPLRDLNWTELRGLRPDLEKCGLESLMTKRREPGSWLLVDVYEMRPDANEELSKPLSRLQEGGVQIIVASPFRRVLDEFKRQPSNLHFGSTDDEIFRILLLADAYLETLAPISAEVLILPDSANRMPTPSPRFFDELRRRKIPIFIRPQSELARFEMSQIRLKESDLVIPR